MRARITGRATLPAVLAASVVAVAAPAVAQAAALDPVAVPVAVPVAESKDCERGLELLKQIKLLPGQPDLAKTLCTLGAAGAGADKPVGDGAGVDGAGAEEVSSTEGRPRGLQMPRDYTPPAAGQPTEHNVQAHDVAEHQNKLLGLPVEWPEGLTVWIPTFQQGEWHSYSNSAADGIQDPAAAPGR
ncbi:hypothetical protein [Actinomadura rifamycini]|uniref:hypothetical protein n=1 Tax=Actinomadura rifamycini TaxID=31962 RepID=UPI0004115DD6|nr:hypothetical protein [Actinomadura rifamycini]